MELPQPTSMSHAASTPPPKWVATLGLGEGSLGHNLFQLDLGQCEHPVSGLWSDTEPP